MNGNDEDEVLEIVVSDEAAHAIRHKGPNIRQLLKMLNSNEERHMPDSRQARWMAAKILQECYDQLEA